MDCFFLFLELKAVPGLHSFGVHTRAHTHTHVHTHVCTHTHPIHRAHPLLVWAGWDCPSELPVLPTPGKLKQKDHRFQAALSNQILTMKSIFWLLISFCLFLYTSLGFFFPTWYTKYYFMWILIVSIKTFYLYLYGVAFAHECCVCRVQQRAPDPLELDLLAAVSGLIDMGAGTILLTTKF